MHYHQAAARALADQGIEAVFGLIGDANLYMIDSFQKLTGGAFYSVANELHGVLAANGYARTSGKLGVATVTHGPALTNTVTALIESVRDRTPLLLLAGDTAMVERYHLQDVAQRDIIMPTGAGFEQARSPETIGEDVAIAVRRALVERRPIVLNIPVEFQWAEVEYTPSPVKYVAPQLVMPDPDALDDAAGIIAVANRPVVIAGQGAMSTEARTALIRLAKRIGAPLATTLRAVNLFGSEPHNLGISGTLAYDVAIETFVQADTIIAFGASLNTWTTAKRSAIAGKRVVHVDIDRDALNKFSPAEAAVVGDATSVANALVTMLDEADVKPTNFASPELAERIASRDTSRYTDVSTDLTVDIRTAVDRIEKALPTDRTFVCDAGRFMLQALTRFSVPEPRAYVHTANFGSIGLSMGNAIGAYVGAPNRPVLVATGDGGFMLGGLAEFNTAVRHGVDLVVALFNDCAYGAEHIQFRAKGMDPSISILDWPDFASVATALGGRGFTIRNLDALDDALDAIKERDRPVLLDIRLDPDKVPAPGW